MALFKVLRGGKDYIDTTHTPLHDGYAYFTEDEGGFYIDNATKRTKINCGTEILCSSSLSAPSPKSTNALWFVTEDTAENGD